MAPQDRPTDPWHNLHPESVLKFGCSVQPATIDGKSTYLATAHATRMYLPEWALDLAVFPQTQRGRHKALAICNKWMDATEARVKAAQPIHAKGDE